MRHFRGRLDLDKLSLSDLAAATNALATLARLHAEGKIAFQTHTGRQRGWELTRASSVACDLLTTREHDILIRIAEGMANKRIARALDISPETVKSHVKKIFIKLTVTARAEAVCQGKLRGLF